MSDTLNVYEIRIEHSARKLILVNRFIISPSCHLKLTSDKENLVLALNDHYMKKSNALVYVIPYQKLVEPYEETIELQNIPHYYAKHIFESTKSQVLK